MQTPNQILEISAARYTHLCPPQVLGSRIGLANMSSAVTVH